MYRTVSSVRRRMSPELYDQGMSALRCPHCHNHFKRSQENQFLTKYWAKCGYCTESVGTDDTELSILPDYQKFLRKQSIFNRVWYHATDRIDWETDLKDASTLIYVPSKGQIERRDDHRIFVHLGSQESAERRSKDLGGLAYTYKVMLLPNKEVSPRVFEDNNWWPHWLGENISSFKQFTEINRYVNRYEVSGSISLLAAYGSFRVVERVKNRKRS